jgi:hypothetical protein
VRGARLRHVLLLVQCALSGLVVAEALLLAVVLHSPILLLVTGLGGGLAVIPVIVAIGLALGCGWARGLGVGYELLLLVSGYVNAIVLRNQDLVSVLVTLALPAMILWLLARMAGWSDAGSPGGSTGS